MLLEYEADILRACDENSTIFVTANGLSNIHSLKHLLLLYANENSLVILLGLDDAEAEYLKRDETDGIPAKYLVDITGLTVSQRNTAYKFGGIFYGPSTLFLHDLLTKNIDTPKISCICILNAERVSKDASEAFIVYIFVEQNPLGIVRAFSSAPLVLKSVTLGVLSRALYAFSVKLYPRYHSLIKSSFGDKRAKFISIKQSSLMEEIGILILDIFKAYKEPSEESAIISRVVRAMNGVSKNYSTCILSRLLALLFSGDPLTFYMYCLKVVEWEHKAKSKDSWTNLPECFVLLGKAREYLVECVNESGGNGNSIIGKIKKKVKEIVEDTEAKEEEDVADEALTTLISKEFYHKNPKYNAIFKLISSQKEDNVVALIVPYKVLEEPTKTVFEVVCPEMQVSVSTSKEFDLCPFDCDTIVLISPTLRSIRIIEKYVSIVNKDIDIYIIAYRESIEEQIYLTEVNEEKNAFEKLTEEQINQTARKDLDILDLEDLDANEEYEITIDSRELRAKLPFYLYKARNRISLQTIPVGDYVFGNWCLERKSIEDFRFSLTSGRLYQQALNMIHTSWYPVLLIEFGDVSPTLMQYDARENLSNTLISNFCLFIYTFFQFKVLWSNNHLFSTKLIRDLQKKNAFRQNITLKVDPVLQEMVLNIPGISASSLRNVFSEFRSIEDMAFASIERLERVLEKSNAKKAPMKEEYLRFRTTCLYCFANIKDGLLVCECNSSLCYNHAYFHMHKTGCQPVAQVVGSSCDTLEVSPIESIYSREINCDEMREKIAMHLQALEFNLKGCPHGEEMSPYCGVVSSDAGCLECDVKDPLWICLECGIMGCGRKQANSKGNGHALQHYESTKHPIVLDIKKLTPLGTTEAYCYACDKFILNPFVGAILSEDSGAHKGKSFFSVPNKLVFAVHPFIGIKNRGQTCYIASTLQLLSKMLYDKNIVWEKHFENCSEPPLNCFCCQFSKVMSALTSQSDKMQWIDIPDFLNTVFLSFKLLERGEQQDACDFIQMLLESIGFYEKAGLIEKISDQFEFEVENTVICRKCGINKKEKSTESILYVTYNESLQGAIDKFFEETEVECECGGRKVLKTSIYEAPKQLIVAIKRYKFENSEIKKITEPVNADAVSVRASEGHEREYKLEGCICHFGDSPNCGHYTFLTMKKDHYFMISDTVINDSKKEDSTNGVVFLLS